MRLVDFYTERFKLRAENALARGRVTVVTLTSDREFAGPRLKLAGKSRLSG